MDHPKDHHSLFGLGPPGVMFCRVCNSQVPRNPIFFFETRSHPPRKKNGVDPFKKTYVIDCDSSSGCLLGGCGKDW